MQYYHIIGNLESREKKKSPLKSHQSNTNTVSIWVNFL
jgi:hypothetical protein